MPEIRRVKNFLSALDRSATDVNVPLDTGEP